MILKAWKDSWKELIGQGGIWSNKAHAYLISKCRQSLAFAGMFIGLVFITIDNALWSKVFIRGIPRVVFLPFSSILSVDKAVLVGSYLLFCLIFSVFISLYFRNDERSAHGKTVLKAACVIVFFHVIFALFFALMTMFAQLLSKAFIDQSMQQVANVFLFSAWPALFLYTYEFVEQIVGVFMHSLELQSIFTLFAQNIFLWINPWIMFALLYLWDKQQEGSCLGALAFSWRSCLYNYPLLLVNHVYVLILLSSSIRLLRKYLNTFSDSGEFSWFIPLLFFAASVWFTLYVANIFYVYELSKKSNYSG